MSWRVEASPVPEGALRAEVEALAGGYELAWHTRMNAHTLPAWFLVRDGGRIVGALSLFDPSGSEAEVSAFVDPQRRREGVFTSMWEAARRTWEAPGRRWLLVVGGDASGTTVAERKGEKSFTEKTLVLPAAARPRFEGLPDGLTVVDGTEAEVDAAARVLAAANEEEVGSTVFLESVVTDPQRRLLLLQEDGRTVGTAGLYKEGEDTHLFALGVHPERQGRGWGRALAMAALDLGAPGTQRFLLDVDSSNGRAEALYRSLGFSDLFVTDYYEVNLEEAAWTI